MAGTDVVVVGAGVMGCALAYELARREVPVTLVDAGQVCGGSSGRNAGGVRQQFSHPTNVALARRTVRRLLDAADELGVDVGLRQVGYLFLVADPARAAALRQAADRQSAAGLPTRWLSPAEVGGLVPGMVVDDLAGASFCPSDGYFDPHSLVTGYAAAARRLGARLLQFRAVTGLRRAGSQLTAVELADGTALPCGTVVNCTGAWADDFARLYGGSLPVTPWRSQCFRLAGVPLPPDCPMTIDFDYGKAYFHPEGPDVIAGMDNETATTATAEVPFDWGKSADVAERLVARLPAFAEARVAGGWAGLLELTPDDNPLVGWTLDNCYTAAGFAGHGLSLAPALAEEVARELVDEPSTLDLDAFRPDRFDRAAGTPPGTASELLAMR
jgi:sarcosine oxidase subunit beta